jgi:probable blue pigment (indigoidine) exporter
MMRRLAALGVLNPGISYALSLLGLARITASLSVLLWALEPVLILMLARGVLGDRLTRGRALAVTAALAGVVLIVWQGGAVGDAGGVALTVAGVGACAVYTVLCRKLLTDDAALPVVLVQQASALVFAVALYAVATPALATAPLGQISGRAWASAIVSGILYYAVAFCFYLAGLKQVAAGTAGVYLTLIPVFGVTAAYLLLGEELTRRQWLGAGIVLVAVVAVVLGVGQHAPRSEPVRPPR